MIKGMRNGVLLIVAEGLDSTCESAYDSLRRSYIYIQLCNSKKLTYFGQHYGHDESSNEKVNFHFVEPVTNNFYFCFE